VIEACSQLARSVKRAQWPNKKDHGELGVNNRLFNVDKGIPFFKNKLGDLGHNPDPILSNDRDDMQPFIL
jgi:hypothetical protein